MFQTKVCLCSDKEGDMETDEHCYEGQQSRACCYVLNVPFKHQKPTIMLFGGDGTHCFPRKMSRDCKKEESSPILMKFFRQSQ